jgi:hypothetical protein
LTASALLDRLPAAIEDGNEPKLKLECIAFHEGAVKHIDAMPKRDVV